VVGAVDAAEAVRRVQQALEDWRGQPLPAVQFPDLSLPTAVVAEEKVLAGKTQSDIVLGVPALRRDDPDYYAARLADTVLGRFGMMGRLGDNVREKLGLAYYSYSALEAGKQPGPWTVVAGVDPANVDRCLAAVDEELARLGTEPVPEPELEDSKAFLTGSLPLRLETNEGVSQSILDMAWYDLGLDHLLRYGDLIQGISPEQVRAVTARYLKPQAYALAVAGPARG
jgi:zinc protease